MSDKKRVIALGFFDGVHIGHGALLDMTRRRAEELGAIPTVMSFDVHPDNLVKGVEVPLISGTEGRTDTIRRLFGIDSVIYIHFNKTVMHMPWTDFIDSAINELDACHFVVGYDFRFGDRGLGSAEKLRDYCGERSIGCDIIQAVQLDGVTVSSTLIRQLITAGDIETANQYLGHPYSLLDTVRYGYQLGAKIGTPTINMQFPRGVLAPRHGVYAAMVFPENDGRRIAVTNVGVRPTVSGGDTLSVESYILDFSGNLYDRRVRVEFHKFLRDERRFESVEKLRDQILSDAESAREYFK